MRTAGPSPLLLAVLIGALFGLGGTGSSAVAVALPALADDLDLSRSTSAWVISAYALTLAVTTALHGRIADLVGIRLPLVAGICLMAAGAIGGALAPSFPVLVAARLAQGAGAASVPVLGAALISIYVRGPERSAALGRVAGTAAAVSSLGPLAGGLLETLGGWRLAMLLPVIGLIFIPALWRAAPSTGPGGGLDLRGATVVAAGGTGLVLLVQSPSTGVVVAVIGATMLVVGGTATVAHVRDRPTGFLPRAVVGNRVVVVSALAAASCPASWFALLVAGPGELSDQGWSTLEIGLGLVPSAVAGVAVSQVSGRIQDRLGQRRTLCLGATVAAAGLLTAAFGVALSSPPLLLVALVGSTVAFGLAQPALTASVDDAVTADVHGVAMGVATFVFLTGAGVGSAALGGLPELFGTAGTLALLAVLPMLGAAAAAVLLRRRPAPAS